MLDKDKLQTVFYVNVKNIDPCDVSTYIEEIADSMSRDNDGSVQYYFIPTTDDRETYIEFHWPPYIPEEERKLPDNLEEYIEENNINIM